MVTRSPIQDTLVEEASHMWAQGNRTLAITFLYYYFNEW